MLGGQLPTVLAMLRKPAMPLIVVESGLPLRPLLPAAKKRSRRVPVSVAALALSIASSSAALLIWLGGDIAGWLAASPMGRAARLAMCVAAGAVAYFAALFISGLRLYHMRSSGA